MRTVFTHEEIAIMHQLDHTSKDILTVRLLAELEQAEDDLTKEYMENCLERLQNISNQEFDELRSLLETPLLL